MRSMASTSASGIDGATFTVTPPPSSSWPIEQTAPGMRCSIIATTLVSVSSSGMARATRSSTSLCSDNRSATQ